MLNNDQLARSKDFIFKNGRLLERVLYDYYFEGGPKEACIKALLAYQNPDGGFGNGIEPDLLCPDSTAIGTETALFVLDLLEVHEGSIVQDLVRWITGAQNEHGAIPHPPKNLFNYPFQPWWQNPDNNRVLVLAGMLKKWGIDNAAFYAKVKSYYQGVPLPESGDFYGYPHFVYLRYCAENQGDHADFSRMISGLPELLAKHRAHFPLFSRYWYTAAEIVDGTTLKKGAEDFVAAIQEDGGLEIPYLDLPWWRPIFTLDGLILMKLYSMDGGIE